MIEFIGRFHPVLVHLPIGIFTMVLLFEFAASLEKFKKLDYAIPMMLFSGIVSAILSIATGLVLAEEGANNKEDVDLHKWIAIGSTCLFIGYYLLRNKMLQIKMLHLASNLLLLISIVLTGHFGGTLTHGEDYLTLSNNEDKNTEAKTINLPDINQAVVYKDIVQHTLNMKCVQCHGEERQKGKLRLDAIESIMAGGKNGNVINVNNVEQSELLKRLLLEENDEHHMPPKEKEQLSDFEKTILQWWIKSGASFDKKVADMQPDEKEKKALVDFKNAYTNSEKQITKERKKVDQISSATRLALEKDGWVIAEISKDDHHIRAVGFNLEIPRDQALKKLLPISEQLVELKLTASGVSDKDLLILNGLKNIEKLWLDENRITDQGIKELNSLEKLSYINLASTGVSKSGIENLLKNKSIQNVYLYQTGIHPNEITSLKNGWKSVKIFGTDSMIKMPTDTIFQKKVK